MKNYRWQDWGSLILGAWLFLSPFVLQYPDFRSLASIHSYILGAGIVLFAALALARHETWEEWITLVLGIWLIVAPFVLDFRAQPVAMWNHIIVGLLVVVEAASVMYEDTTHRGAAAR